MNKPLDAAEVKVYGNQARMILGFEFGVVMMLLIAIGQNNVSECVSVSHLTLSFIVVIGKLKNLNYYKEEI